MTAQDLGWETIPQLIERGISFDEMKTYYYTKRHHWTAGNLANHPKLSSYTPSIEEVKEYYDLISVPGAKMKMFREQAEYLNRKKEVETLVLSLINEIRYLQSNIQAAPKEYQESLKKFHDHLRYVDNNCIAIDPEKTTSVLIDLLFLKPNE